MTHKKLSHGSIYTRNKQRKIETNTRNYATLLCEVRNTEHTASNAHTRLIWVFPPGCTYFTSLHPTLCRYNDTATI